LSLLSGVRDLNWGDDDYCLLKLGDFTLEVSYLPVP
jgi:hypothetical protein